MKALYITQHFATPDSSTGSRHWWATRELLNKGWDVLILTGPTRLPTHSRPRHLLSRLRLDRADVFILELKYNQKMGFARRCWSFLEFMIGTTILALCMPRPDVVFATSCPLTVALPGIAARVLRGIPFVFEARDLWPDIPIELGFIRGRLLKRLLLRFEKLAYRRARAIVALSPGARDAVTAKGIPEAKVVVIPNLSDTDFFGNGPDGRAFRQRHGLEDKFVCAHTGAMGFVNGLGAVLDAAALLRDSRPDIVFLLVGDGNERPELEARVRGEGLANVRIMDPIPKTDMPECLAAVDLGLTTVRNFRILEHNSANKFFDYLAAGKPVLLNYGGWQAEWLSRYEAGVAVPPDDPRAMADAIVRLETDRRRLKEMGRNARRLAEEQFERKRHMARLEKVLRQAALGRKGRAIAVEPWPFEERS